MSELEIHGHRGSRGTHPENTVAGFRAAMAAGADVLELDLGLTRDEVVVVHHDEALNVDTARRDGQWLAAEIPLRDLTYDQLQEYDVGRLRPGSSYSYRFPHQTPVDGARIPTFAEVLALDHRLNVEIKVSPEWASDRVDRFVELVVLEVDAHEARSRVRLQSFDWRVPTAISRIAPELSRSCLTSPDTVGRSAESGWAAGWRLVDYDGSLVHMIRATTCDTWSPAYIGLRADQVREAHALGLRVVPWTVNESQDLLRIAAMRVDAIITDYPARAVSLLRGH